MANNENMQTFCTNIKYLRKAHKFSQKEMAAICGVSPLSIRKLENGIIPKRLGASIFVNINSALGLSPSALLTYLIEHQENLTKNP